MCDYNASYFVRALETPERRARLPLPPPSRRGAVLTLTNLAFLVTGVAPVLPAQAWRPGLHTLVGLFPLSAAPAMTTLILRNRVRR